MVSWKEEGGGWCGEKRKVMGGVLKRGRWWWGIW